VNDVTAGLYVSGSLNQPKLDIFSEPAMGQTDALAYLILGRPLESADNEDGDKMAKAALALGLTGGDIIARSLGDRFGLDDMRIETSDQGDQAALVVGRYLSPKLYASYGVGLIESVNTISVRYHISKKWLLKAESGGYQGADILYTIER
jgi:translocation and assembly module TamB